MVVIKIMGGTGNQLFQYAFGRYLEKRYGCEVEYNIDFFNLQPADLDKRKFELSNIVADIIINDSRFLAEFNNLRKFSKFKFFLVKILNCPRDIFFPFSEFFSKFAWLLEKIFGRVYLVGYWQNRKYVDWLYSNDHMKLIDQHLDQRIYSLITVAKNPVSVGVRRGDFVKLGVAADYEYYRLAIEYIKVRIEDPLFIVFSDDIEWCRAVFDGSLDAFEFVEMNHDRPFANVLLMSHCSSHIVSRSTFDWWGAYLNFGTPRIVIGPKNWALGASLGAKEI